MDDKGVLQEQNIADAVKDMAPDTSGLEHLNRAFETFPVFNDAQQRFTEEHPVWKEKISVQAASGTQLRVLTRGKVTNRDLILLRALLDSLLEEDKPDA